MLAWLRIVHRWIGLILAVIVAAVSLSGVLLLLRAPYYRTVFPSLARPVTGTDEARRAEILATIEATYAGEGLRLIVFPRAGENAYHVYLADEVEAFLDVERAHLIARWTWRDSLPAFLFNLHAHLLLGRPGTTMNGIVALAMVFLTLTGVLLWWPLRASAFQLRRALPRGGSAGELLRSHGAAGMWLLPSLIFTMTGAGLVFYTPISAMLTATLDRTPAVQPSAIVTRRDAPHRPWAEILARVDETFPGGRLVMYTPGLSENAVMRFRLRLPGEWHPNGRSYVLVDPYEGRVVQTIDARTHGPGTRVMNAVYGLHAAKVGGLAYALFAASVGLGLLWLAVSGTGAYLQKLRITRRTRERRVAVSAAASAQD